MATRRGKPALTSVPPATQPQVAQAQQKLAKTWPAKGTVLESLAYAKVAEVSAPGER
jgi:hypothetical protein